MTKEQKVKSINKYINNIISNMRNNGVVVNKTALTKARNKYINSEKDIEVIYKEIDDQIESYLRDYNDKLVYFEKIKKLKIINESNRVPFLGESYKTYIIDLFRILENINLEYDLDVVQKEIRFNTELTKYLFRKKPELEKFYEKQCSDSKKVQFNLKEAFLGSDSLDYVTVTNLYNTFINNITLICPEIEGRMNYIVRNDKKIFNSDGSIHKGIYDFSYLENIFNYSKEKNKLLKLPSIIKHSEVPENLEKEINEIEVDKRRDYLLRFIDDYCNNLSSWALNNGYDFRQIEGISEIADSSEKSMIKESFWSKNIGVNPENGDNYYIDILKIIRKYFVFNEIIYSEYNEFDTSKCNRICGICNDIIEKGKRDSFNYIDALGLQSHYTTWFIKDDTRVELTNSMIYQTMYEYKKLNIPLYRTEIDFKRFRYDTDNYNSLIDSRYKADQESNINGYIIWGNSAKLTWFFCEGMNSHAIDGKGNETKEFKRLKEYTDYLERKYNSADRFVEKDYIYDLIIYANKEIQNLKLDSKDKEKRVSDIYNFYYNSLDKLINPRMRKKNKLAIEKTKVYLKNCITIGCSRIDEFKECMILLNSYSDNVDIDKRIEEFKLSLVHHKDIDVVVKKESNVFNYFLIVFCILYVIFSIICIILGLRLL